jgi:predicted metalloprotease with PDZ domain
VRGCEARLRLIVLAFVAVMARPDLGAQADTIFYIVRFPSPSTHYVVIEAEYPTRGQRDIELTMAVWTPGSYLVREYARNVEDVTARTQTGKAVRVEKTLKNHWRVTTGGSPSVIVTYRVYCREMTVRTNWVEDAFAMLNGAPTFITLADMAKRPHDVRLELPPAWKTSATALPPVNDRLPHHYRAPDFDTLVDSPIVAGNPDVHTFDVDGKLHALVDTPAAHEFDGARAAGDIRKIVEQDRKLWGSLPYDAYRYLNVVTEASGGLEHKNSQLIMSSRWATRTRPAYLGFLALVSHEYFHAWNVKRLRPVALGPFDYEHEVYTKDLWISEGLTDYYGDLQLRRTRVPTEQEFLDVLSDAIETLQTTPGRLVQPVEQASFDAWIKAYRTDENTRNSAISYYTKGEVLGFILDAKIRKATNGQKSLDDVMRTAYQRFSGEKGFTSQDFRAVTRDVAGVDFTDWFVTALETTAEVEYTDPLDWYGLRFKSAERTGRATLGIEWREEGGRLLVSKVLRGTPAIAAGLDVDDEILALDDVRVRADQFERRLEQYKPGDAITVLIARRGQIRRLPVTLGEEPASTWRLEVRPDATVEQNARRTAWQQG